MTDTEVAQAVDLVVAEARRLLALAGRGGTGTASPESLASPALNGRFVVAAPDLERVSAWADVLEQLVGMLSGGRPAEVPPALDATRTLLEAIHGQTLTFAWERARAPSGERVDGRAHADVVAGKLVGLRIRRMGPGDAFGQARAGTSRDGGATIGVEIDRLGR